LIQEFAKVLNHTNQGMCIAFPQSVEQGLRFSIFPICVNMTSDLTRNLTTKIP